MMLGPSPNMGMTKPLHGKIRHAFNMAHMVCPKLGPYPNTVMVFRTQMVIWSSKVLEMAILGPSMPLSSNFNIYLCWFSVHLILLFRIWGTCIDLSLPQLCQNSETYLHLKVPYTLLFAGCIAISLLKSPLEFIKSRLFEPFRWQSS